MKIGQMVGIFDDIDEVPAVVEDNLREKKENETYRRSLLLPRKQSSMMFSIIPLKSIQTQILVLRKEYSLLVRQDVRRKNPKSLW